MFVWFSYYYYIHQHWTTFSTSNPFHKLCWELISLYTVLNNRRNSLHHCHILASVSLTVHNCCNYLIANKLNFTVTSVFDMPVCIWNFCVGHLPKYFEFININWFFSQQSWWWSATTIWRRRLWATSKTFKRATKLQRQNWQTR